VIQATRVKTVREITPVTGCLQRTRSTCATTLLNSFLLRFG
jgi:hypothetical protein